MTISPPASSGVGRLGVRLLGLLALLTLTACSEITVGIGIDDPLSPERSVRVDLYSAHSSNKLLDKIGKAHD